MYSHAAPTHVARHHYGLFLSPTSLSLVDEYECDKKMPPTIDWEILFSVKWRPNRVTEKNLQRSCVTSTQLTRQWLYFLSALVSSSMTETIKQKKTNGFLCELLAKQ